jgi:hypothetical protein
MSKALFAHFSLRTLMQRQINNTLYRWLFAWRLADYIHRRSYKGPLQNNRDFDPFRYDGHGQQSVAHSLDG